MSDGTAAVIQSLILKYCPHRTDLYQEALQFEKREEWLDRAESWLAERRRPLTESELEAMTSEQRCDYWVMLQKTGHLNLGKSWAEMSASDRAIFVSHLNQYSENLDGPPSKPPIATLDDIEERKAIQDEKPKRHRWESF